MLSYRSFISIIDKKEKNTNFFLAENLIQSDWEYFRLQNVAFIHLEKCLWKNFTNFYITDIGCRIEDDGVWKLVKYYTKMVT